MSWSEQAVAGKSACVQALKPLVVLRVLVRMLVQLSDAISPEALKPLVLAAQTSLEEWSC